ncbi:4-carboxy-4-hydroxy-2-oxoadipate aldolase/oxaloacetate decarboxylase [Pseudogemmobacter humi]|uniref:Putative 4-hydroxy-4-methyl-2-oxoglutarate aldolase n=1 Tax=Pseudogemmobacter humi TaxID=2483812 RepID=A0A3P5WSQ8_9RHOB|nr:4-carboxy-4-hydroxy-2-oxoadipate aldolase/oxaloacetate decarboxylase [Pseudogemmobacter humi]VDC22341.1 4-hydroxy-4-methyl-2-oxoglutarate aldolase [Pseudogemmobacter humi]
MSFRPNAEQIEKLKRIGAATLHEAQGQTGALDSGLKPLDAGLRLAGTAFTVDCRAHDNLAIHLAVTMAGPGDILVVDAKGFIEAGPWGDILTLGAQKRGIAGLVIDGAVRDSEEIIAMRFPVFARGLSIKGTLKAQPGRIGAPVICGGQQIRTGDIIVGDRDGLVVVRPERLDEVLTAAAAREEAERRMRERLEAGETTLEILGLEPALKRLGMI